MYGGNKCNNPSPHESMIDDFACFDAAYSITKTYDMVFFQN